MTTDADSDVQDVHRLAGRRVLVVGDLVLDEYLTGRMTRISREAPVPILEIAEAEDRAGSAARYGTSAGMVSSRESWSRRNPRSS